MLDLKLAGIAGVVALAVGGLATAAAYEKLIVPGRLADERAAVTRLVTESVTRERDLVCKTTIADATAIARQAAIDHERANAEAALAAFAAKAAARAEADARQIETLEQESQDYEEKLAAAGRACSLDLSDIEWLREHGFAIRPGTP